MIGFDVWKYALKKKKKKIRHNREDSSKNEERGLAS